jgi:hypothetical protein
MGNDATPHNAPHVNAEIPTVAAWFPTELFGGHPAEVKNARQQVADERARLVEIG